MFVFLWPAYFNWHNVLKVPPCSNTHQKFPPFEGWIIPIACAHAHFMYPFIPRRTLGWLSPLAVGSSAAWARGHKGLFALPLAVLLGLCLEVELLDHIVAPHFIFWGTAMSFSIAATPCFLFISFCVVFGRVQWKNVCTMKHDRRGLKFRVNAVLHVQHPTVETS